jgi:hypothetical protein
MKQWGPRACLGWIWPNRNRSEVGEIATPGDKSAFGLVHFASTVREWAMNKLNMTQIKQVSARYYAVGICVFSAAFGILAVIAELVKRNS